MPSRPLWPVFIALLFSVSAVYATESTTIPPKGVRAFVYQYVRANVPSSFGETGVEKDFRVNETFGESVIRAISPDTSSAYDQLKAVSPDAAAAINLGNVNVNPDINVDAHVIGLAWGLTDWLMIAGGVPIMKAKVNVEGGYTDLGAVRASIDRLRATTDPAVQAKAFAMADALEQSIQPLLRGEILQGVVVNEFEYKPVGDWEGSGIGDTTLFAEARAINWDFYKSAVKLGVDLPTGRADDPDNLVDVPFGQGYTDTFIESLNDFVVHPEYFIFSVSGRYQENWSANRTFRLAPSIDFPLTSEKETIHYNPGNVWSTTLEASTRFFRALELDVQYTTKHKAKDSIRGTRTDYDYGILEHKTATLTNTAKATLSYSTVDAFLRGKFPVPFKVGTTLSRVVSGINTERVNMVSLDFQMYF